jgi:hypothetical protein
MGMLKIQGGGLVHFSARDLHLSVILLSLISSPKANAQPFGVLYTAVS